MLPIFVRFPPCHQSNMITILTSATGFRHGWHYHGFTTDQLPYQAAFGIWGSYVGSILCAIAIAATFYTSLFPLHSKPDAKVFFENFLAAPIVIALYLGWKIYSRDW